MLCSAKELGIDDDASGLLALDASLVPGTPLRDALALDDTLITLKLTPNRADLPVPRRNRARGCGTHRRAADAAGGTPDARHVRRGADSARHGWTGLSPALSRA
jgi:hypothetical protein